MTPVTRHSCGWLLFFYFFTSLATSAARHAELCYANKFSYVPFAVTVQSFCLVCCNLVYDCFQFQIMFDQFHPYVRCRQKRNKTGGAILRMASG